MTQKKILIADDSQSIREILTAILEDAGHSVWVAEDGAEALRKVRVLSPDILILDIMMPGLNGYDVCRTIKSDPDLKRTFILILSAKDQLTEKELGREVGADDYLVKPFRLGDMIARINNYPG